MLPEKIYTYWVDEDQILCFKLAKEEEKIFKALLQEKETTYVEGTYSSEVFFDETLCFYLDEKDGWDKEWKEGVYGGEGGLKFFKSIEEAKYDRDRIVREKYLLWQSRLYCAPKVVD